VVQAVKVTINRDSTDDIEGTEWAAIHVLLHDRMMKIPAWE